MEISFLLDTNVVIQFEEVGPDKKIKDRFHQLHALLVEYGLTFRYHPLTIDDLQNDPKSDRLAELLSRIQKYPKIDQPPLADGVELEKTFGGITKVNDTIDCQLLFAIKRNCATYLVTEDTGIHRRSRHANIDERVLDVQEAIDLIIRRFRPQTIQLPNVNHEYVYNLDIAASIFDSLKNDYAGFEKWVEEKAQENRRCWTIKVNNELAGICIYKHDDKQEHSGIPMPSMKLCTFKVSDSHEGRKFGELLLKMAHQHAVKNALTSMWVTTHEKQEKLISFLRRFGFQLHSDMKGRDMVFYKLMHPPNDLPLMDPLEFHILYSPHYYDYEEIQKFIIPIQPKFHDVLFPELAPQPTLQGLNTGESVPGNTIRKVYLSHSNKKTIPLGSLVFFYRSSPEQYIQTMAIVERARRLKDMDSLVAAIGKRSVYSHEEVKKMIKKEVLVIDFRIIAASDTPIPVAELVDKGVFRNRPTQTIMELDNTRYAKLKKLWAKKNQ